MPPKQPLKLKSPPATWAYCPIPENYPSSDSCVLPNTYGRTLSYTYYFLVRDKARGSRNATEMR